MLEKSSTSHVLKPYHKEHQKCFSEIPVFKFPNLRAILLKCSQYTILSDKIYFSVRNIMLKIRINLLYFLKKFYLFIIIN